MWRWNTPLVAVILSVIMVSESSISSFFCLDTKVTKIKYPGIFPLRVHSLNRITWVLMWSKFISHVESALCYWHRFLFVVVSFSFLSLSWNIKHLESWFSNFVELVKPPETYFCKVLGIPLILCQLLEKSNTCTMVKARYNWTVFEHHKVGDSTKPRSSTTIGKARVLDGFYHRVSFQHGPMEPPRHLWSLAYHCSQCQRSFCLRSRCKLRPCQKTYFSF